MKFERLWTTQRLLQFFAALIIVVVGSLVPLSLAYSAPEVRFKAESLGSVNANQTREYALPFATSHVAVKWLGDHEAKVSLSWKIDNTWQPFVDLVDDEDANMTPETNPWISSPVIPVNNANAVRVRGGEKLAEVKVFAIDTVNGSRHLIVSPNDEQANAVTAPSVISRSGWGADESIRKGSPEFAPVKRFIVHHTVTQVPDNNPSATVRAIYAFHVQGNGWNDIGYNYLIDRQGRVYEGRYSRNYGAGVTPSADNASGDGVIGAHAAGYNTGSIGIAFLGTYTSMSPGTAALDSAARLMAWQGQRHGITVNQTNVFGHRDVGQTSCPGNGLYNELNRLRRDAGIAVGDNVANPKGYYISTPGGYVSAIGTVHSRGDRMGQPLAGAIMSITTTNDGKGYWLLGSDGGIFSYGNAHFYGSMGGKPLNKPVVAIEPTPSGNGYWLVASDGGIFAFGDAGFHGSTGGMRLNRPIVGMASSPSGNGYWLVASDGGIFSFGDAQFKGSMGGQHLNRPIVGMARAGNGQGYWMVASDGGIFAFNAPFYGSASGKTSGVAQMQPTASGHGYLLVGANGDVFSYGDAPWYGGFPGRATDIATVGL